MSFEDFKELVDEIAGSLAREGEERLFYRDEQAAILCCDVLEGLKALPDRSVQMVMTSPPYWGLRDYGDPNQLGLEPTWVDYIRRLVAVFREVWRVLRDDGAVYLNMGDTYMKKNLMMIPSTLAMALRFDGWVVRNDIIWSKVNAMPASVKDRLSNRHEHILFMVKGRRPEDAEVRVENFLQVLSTLDIEEPHCYYFDLDAIRVPHKTQSLERYQRGLNQKAFGRPYDGKFLGIKDLVNEKGGMQASALRRGVSVNPPKWFEEGMPPDKDYNGKFDSMGRHHGSGPQSKLTGLGRAGQLLLLERPGSKANNLDLRVSHQNRNFMPYRPRHFELLSGEDKARVLAALAAGLRVDIVTEATAASIRAHDSGRAREIEEKGYAIYINHPLGGNPGDVVKTGKYLENPSPGGRSSVRMGKELAQAFEDGTALHPLGRNPGDVVKGRGPETEGRPLHPPHHHYRGDGWERQNPDMELHPAGANPGDVTRASLSETPALDGEGPGDFWEINTRPFTGAHFAVFPEAICLRPILSSSKPGDVVLDPFCGSGTALAVAKKLGRKAIGIDLVARYCQMAKEQITRLEIEAIPCPRDGSQVLFTRDTAQHRKSNPGKNDVCLGRVPFEIGETPCRNCQRGKLLVESTTGGDKT